MKAIYLSIALVFSSLFSLSAQQGDSDPAAKKILDAVSAKYRSYDALKASFSYTMSSPEAGSESMTGVFYLKPRGNQYRIVTEGQEFISDGTTSWVYLEEVNEVQVSQVGEESGLLKNPSDLFTLHEKGFKYRLKGEATLDGKSMQLIDLVPLEDSPYSRIELSVDKAASQLRQFRIFEKSGIQHIYKIEKLTVNPSLEKDLFVFDKSDHPGVEVVDLR